MNDIPTLIKGGDDIAELQLVHPASQRESDGNAALDKRAAAAQLATLRGSHVQQARDQLDAIVATTEHSANQILDACDALSELAGELDARLGDRLDQAVTVIYEACGFQDLTGQRVANVAKTLSAVDGMLGTLLQMVALPASELATQCIGECVQAASSSEKGLLHGPQRPKDAIDQSVADRLFAQPG